MADGRRDHGRHVVRAICPAHLERKSAHARRIRRHANPPLFDAPDKPIYRRARDERAYFRVVRHRAEPGRAGLYGSQLRCVTGEPWNRVEGAVSMGSSSNIFRMADTFDWLCDVLSERPQHYTDRDDASLYGLANRSGRSTFECGSRVPSLHGSGPVSFVARGGLSEVWSRAPAGPPPIPATSELQCGRGRAYPSGRFRLPAESKESSRKRVRRSPRLPTAAEPWRPRRSRARAETGPQRWRACSRCSGA